MCDGSKHKLTVIHRAGNSAEMAVIRWCMDCGAVVVDIDYDGRTMAGGILKMQFPSGERTKR